MLISLLNVYRIIYLFSEWKSKFRNGFKHACAVRTQNDSWTIWRSLEIRPNVTEHAMKSEYDHCFHWTECTMCVVWLYWYCLNEVLYASGQILHKLRRCWCTNPGHQPRTSVSFMFHWKQSYYCYLWIE